MAKSFYSKTPDSPKSPPWVLSSTQPLETRFQSGLKSPLGLPANAAVGRFSARFLLDLAAGLVGADSVEQVARLSVAALSKRVKADAGSFVVLSQGRLQIICSAGLPEKTVHSAFGTGFRTGRPLGDVAVTGGDGQTILDLMVGQDAEAHILLSGAEARVNWLTAHAKAIAHLVSQALDRVSGDERPEPDAIAVLSHEMRTPLTSIKGYASSLLREDAKWDPDAVTEFAHLIDEEADSLTNMIEEILEHMATNSSGLELSCEPVLIPQLTAGVLREVQAVSDRHTFTLEVPADISPVWADPTRVKQVLRNLLQNAAKYASPGRVTVHVAQRGEEVAVSVTDQGPGIKAEHMEHLFDRYFRIKDPRRSVVGAGLGLPIARDIVERHGGRLWATSHEGKGTTFTFTLPVAPR